MPIVSAPPRRAAATAALLLLLGALAACGPLKQYFPSRDEVFKPVPVTLGEERVVAGDTSYVLAGRGYRVVTRERDLLPDAKSSLDRVSFAFRRFMSVDPPTVDVQLRLLERRRNARPDSAARVADTAGVVTMVAWREGRDDRRAGPGGTMGGARVPATTLVRRWLSALTDSITHTPAPRLVLAEATPAGDSARAAAAAAAAAAARRPFDAPPASDPRIPDWIERAIPALVAGSPDPEYASAQLARQKDKLIPLRALLTQSAPTGDRGDDARAARGAPGQGGDPRNAPPETRGGYRGPAGGVRGERGRGRALEGRALFDAEAVSVAAYLAEREGSAFVGDLFRTLVGGGTLEDALRGTHSVAHDLDGFERGWRGWLDEQGARVEERAGR